jgi:molybdopterin-guanine dinucleotide biosynthesis protein MobB
VIGFAAYSGSGKTTLLKQVIPILCARGLSVSVIKHAHHEFDIDYPGKDSYELRHAGASQVLIGSTHRSALIRERDDPKEPEIGEMLEQLHTEEVDLIIVEGFRHDTLPKIEVYRAEIGRPYLFEQDDSIIAVVSDRVVSGRPKLPKLDLNDAAAVADFVLSYCRNA